MCSSAERIALQKEYNEFKSTAAASRERMYSQLVSSIDMLTLHKENVEAQVPPHTFPPARTYRAAWPRLATHQFRLSLSCESRGPSHFVWWQLAGLKKHCAAKMDSLISSLREEPVDLA